MSHLSIGEVLALLLEEFPDVTISKIRFLESQGLIDPERTPSGYRKFYDDDVELLRCILREQRENYLPLRVIKDRLDSGEIDPTSETPRPRGIRNMPDDDAVAAHPAASPSASTGADALFARTDGPRPDDETPAEASDPTPAVVPIPPSSKVAKPTIEPAPAPGVLLTRDELCSMVPIDAAALESLESYGVVSGIRGSGGLYGAEALEIATIAKRFLDVGFDARHLRGWKVGTWRSIDG